MSDPNFEDEGEFTYAAVRLQRDARIPAAEFSRDVEDLLTLVAFATYLGSDEEETGFAIDDGALNDLMVEYAHYGSPLDLDFIAIAQTAQDLWNGRAGLLATLGIVTVAWNKYQTGRNQKWEADTKKYDLQKRKREDAAEALRHAASNLPDEARMYEKAADAFLNGKSRRKLLRAMETASESDFRMRVDRTGFDLRFRRRRFGNIFGPDQPGIDPWDSDDDVR